MGLRLRYTGGFNKRGRATEEDLSPTEVLKFKKGEVVDVHPLVARRLLRYRPDDFERVMAGEDGYDGASAAEVVVHEAAPSPPVEQPYEPELVLEPGDRLVLSVEDAARLMETHPGMFAMSPD